MVNTDSGVFDNKKKNVLLVVRWPVGGIRTFLNYVLKNFPLDSYRIFMLTTSESGFDFLYEDVNQFVHKWFVVSRDSSVEKRLAIDALKITHKLRIDLIHAHGFTSLVCAFPSSLALGIPMVFTSHDVINEFQFNGPKGLIQKMVVGFALNRCSVVQSVSRDAEENLLSFFPGISGKSVCVRNGIDVDRFFFASELPIRDGLSIGKKTPLIGFFGRFMNQKGFSFLVESIRILKYDKDFDIHVVCFGSGAYIREEKDQIEKKGLGSFFTFVPFLADVSGAMKGCDLIVMPSLWEACPLQPMEALCAGVPFVGSNCIGLREVLEGTPAIKVNAGDAESLAEGIMRGLELGKEPFREFMSLAVERFDVRKTATGIAKIYSEAVKE